MAEDCPHLPAVFSNDTHRHGPQWLKCDYVTSSLAQLQVHIHTRGMNMAIPTGERATPTDICTCRYAVTSVSGISCATTWVIS